MEIKLIVFAFISLIICFLLNSVAVIYSIISFIGYSLITLILGWTVTSHVMHKINTCGLWRVNPAKKIVVITGCDSGFGHQTAKQLNKYGFTVFATCLFPDGEGAKQLRTQASNPENMIIIGCDVTKDEDIDKVYKQLNKFVSNGYELWGLVNNAGMCVVAEIEWGSFERNFGDTFRVNCFGVVKITRKCLPLLRRTKGRVVIISSVASRFSLPTTASYSMTKSAVVSFADGLRLSMRRFGVKVTCIDPCGYSTPLAQNVGQTSKKLWEETDNSIRNDYGEQCYENMIESVESIKNKLLNKNIEDVSDAVLTALVSPFPNLRQICGAIPMRLLFSLISIIPTDFTYTLQQYV